MAGNLYRRGFTFVEVLVALTIGVILMVAIATAMFASAENMKANSDFAEATQTARAAVQAIGAAVRASYTCDVGEGLPPLLDPADPSKPFTPLSELPATLSANILYITPVDASGAVGSKVAYVYDDYDAKAKRLLLDTTPTGPQLSNTTLPAALPGIRSRVGSTVFVLADKAEPAGPVVMVNGKAVRFGFTGTYDVRKYKDPDPTQPLQKPELRLVNVQVHLKVGVDSSVLDLSDSVVPRTSYAQ